MKGFKKFLVTFLTFCMMFSALSTTVMADNDYVKPFTDVSASSWYKNSVQYVYNTGLMNGITTTTFEPDSTLTRSMFVTILGRMDGVDTKKYSGSSFADVAVGQWYSPYVQWASANNIVTGYSNGLFGTNDPVTREEMATMISRYLNAKGITLPDSENAVTGFHDAAAVSEWAKEGLELMRRTGIIVGDINQCFNPRNTASRAEAATVFMRLKELALGPVFLQSCQIQEYNGTIYTVLSMDSHSGMTVIPNCNYMSQMIIHNGYIYYTSPGGTGVESVPLYRMKLDGSDHRVLIRKMASYESFCIYNNKLYYSTYTSDYESVGNVMDLNTLQTYSYDFTFAYGNKNVWIVNGKDWQDNYYSYPDYNYIQGLSYDLYDSWKEEGIIGVYNDYIYYLTDSKIMRFSIYNPNIHEFAVDSYSVNRCFIVGDGLYYTETGNPYLKRFDLNKNTYQLYNLSNNVSNMNSFWEIAEVNGKLYFTSYNGQMQENTDCWELNLSDGTMRLIGRWFES